MSANERGFTIIEVLVAVVVLSIGIVALVASSAMVTRMVGRGKASTYASQMATERLEWLRSIAASTATPCTSANFANGSQPDSNHVSVSWKVELAGPSTRRIMVFAAYKSPNGVRTRVDTVSTIVPCLS